MHATTARTSSDQLGSWQETRVVLFTGQYDTLKDQPDKRYDTISLTEIVDLVREPVTAEKERAPATIGSTYCEHDARTHDVQRNQGKYALLRFDIDSGNLPLGDVAQAFTYVLPGNSFWIYSTSSATPDNKRWRVLVPLLEPVCHDVRRAAEVILREDIDRLYGFEFDQALDRAGQHIYLPTVAPDKRRDDGEPLYYEHKVVDGAVLDLQQSRLQAQIQALLEKQRRDEELRQMVLAERRERVRERRNAAARDGNADLSPIAYFNEVADLPELLVEAGYEQSPADPRDWRSPYQRSGSYATRVEGDHFVSLSQSDAEAGVGIATRHGNRCGDAFSIFVHYMHGGDRNSAIREIQARRDFAVAAETVIAADAFPRIVPITLEELDSARETPRILVPGFLFADARTRIAPGGTSKTTVALHEAIKLSLGLPIWGREPVGPIRTVLVTREDSREILVGRMRQVMDGLMLDSAQRQKALENITILDFTDRSFRLSAVKDDVVVPHHANLQAMKEVLYDWKPDWLICDPLVSFGVGESRVNDAEQGLIEAFRMLRNELDCCVEGIHHTGKAVSRDKILDQYAGRGGSALADGCRMVAVMQPLNDAEWSRATGLALEKGQQGLVMALPKMSYCAPQPPIYILRRHFSFTHVQGLSQLDKESHSAALAERLYEFIAGEYARGRRYTQTDLEVKARDHLSMKRQEVRDACIYLKASGRVVYHEVRGRAGAHFEPLGFGDAADEPILT